MFWHDLGIYLLIATPIVLPLTMFIFGIIMMRGRPRKVYRFVGFCTKRARSSPEAWRWVHYKLGKNWRNWGAILLIVAVVIIGSFFIIAVMSENLAPDGFFEPSEWNFLFGITIYIILAYYFVVNPLVWLVLAATLIGAQVGLCSRFNKNGTPKST